MLLYQSELNEDITNEIYIQWLITYTCNYNCSYCYLRNNNLLNKDYNKFIPYAHFKLGINKIKKHLDIKNIRFDIMGGEPTLHPELFNIVNYTCNTGFKKVVLNTNGSKLLQHLDKINDYDNFKIALSFHPNKNSFDNYIKIIDSILNRNIDLEVHVMFAEEHFDESYNMYKYLNKCYNSIELIIGIILPLSYSEKNNALLETLIEENKQINKRKFIFKYDKETKIYTDKEIRLYNLNKFEGMRCFVRYFTIDLNGNINVLCDENILNSRKIYFNSTFNLIKKLLNQGVICNHQECGCTIGYNFKKVIDNG